jgi:hypothetical protein
VLKKNFFKRKLTSYNGRDAECIKNIIAPKPKTNTSTVRLRRRLEDNIKIDIKDAGREDVGWVHLVQWWPDVNTFMNARVLCRGSGIS